MTVERRIRMTAGVLIVFAVGTAALLSWSSRLVEDGIRATDSASQVVRSAFMLSLLTERNLIHGDKRTQRQWDKQREILGQTLNEMNSEAIDGALFTDLKNKFQAVNSLSPQIMQMGPRNNGNEHQDQRMTEMIASLMFLRLEKLVNAANDLSGTTYALTLKRRHFVGYIILAMGFSMVIVILIHIYLIRQSVVDPLKALAAGAERIGAGNFDYVAETKSDDEVGKLALAFNTMIERLHEREERLRLFIEHAPAAIAMFDTEMRYLAVSRRWMRDYRLDEGVIVGRSHYEIFHEVPDRWKAVHRRALEGEVVRADEDCFERQEGPAQWLRWEVRPWSTASGSIGGIIIFTEDITERKQAEQELQTTLQRFYSILSSQYDGLLLVSEEDRIEFANQAFCDQYELEMPPSALLGRTSPDIIERIGHVYAEPDQEVSRIREIVQQWRPVKGEEIAIRGGKTYLRDFVPIEVDGKHFGRLWHHRDITDRKRTEDELKKAHDELELRIKERTGELQLSNMELERSNADLQQFAYVASHDLQEPLRNIASCLQLLEKDYKNRLSADADQYIHYAVDSAVRMKALILDLLAYSRVATRGKPLEQTDCEQILGRALQNLDLAITETGALITHDPLPTILADDTQLLQAFQNLIQNAIKFRGNDSPHIHVSAVKDKQEWIFSIKDNGIGIGSQHLDRIFVIFQRLHKRSEYEGTGMGLAIVKKVVERHGGRVWAESEPGVGTTVYFALPSSNRKI